MKCLAIPRRPLWALAGLALLLLLAAPADPGLGLALTPALALLALLASGIRPGEALIARLHARRGLRRLRPASARRPRLALIVRRAGRRLACALAMRPPPAAVAAR